MRAEVKIPKGWRRVRPGSRVHVGDEWKDVEDGRVVGRWTRINFADNSSAGFVGPATAEIVIRRVKGGKRCG